jgi:hypothetical protein
MCPFRKIGINYSPETVVGPGKIKKKQWGKTNKVFEMHNYCKYHIIELSRHSKLVA